MRWGYNKPKFKLILLVRPSIEKGPKYLIKYEAKAFAKNSQISYIRLTVIFLSFFYSFFDKFLFLECNDTKYFPNFLSFL